MLYIIKLPVKLKLLLLSLFFILFSFGHAYSNDLMGQEIFIAECVGCHSVKAPAEPLSIAEALQVKGPSLRYAGSKFKSAYLLTWLQDPKPIRPLEYNSLIKKNTGSHKKLTRAESADVTRYLMSLRFEKAGVGDLQEVKIKPKDNIVGRQIFNQRHSCYACHRVRSDSGLTGGLSGPSLADIGSRLQPFWIYKFLLEPRRVVTNGSMPTYAGIIDDKETLRLVEYLTTLK